MKATLEHLVRHCHGDERPDCPIIEGLAEKAAVLSPAARPHAQGVGTGLRRGRQQATR
jgi:MerR family copper efflux transcriptional regulator